MADKFFISNRGFLRLPTVLKLIPVGKSTWWAGVKTGRFPKPVKLGKRITAWRADEIHALIQSLSLPQQGMRHVQRLCSGQCVSVIDEDL